MTFDRNNIIYSCDLIHGATTPTSIIARFSSTTVAPCLTSSAMRRGARWPERDRQTFHKCFRCRWFNLSYKPWQTLCRLRASDAVWKVLGVKCPSVEPYKWFNFKGPFEVVMFEYFCWEWLFLFEVPWEGIVYAVCNTLASASHNRLTVYVYFWQILLFNTHCWALNEEKTFSCQMGLYHRTIPASFSRSHGQFQ